MPDPEYCDPTASIVEVLSTGSSEQTRSSRQQDDLPAGLSAALL